MSLQHWQPDLYRRYLEIDRDPSADPFSAEEVETLASAAALDQMTNSELRTATIMLAGYLKASRWGRTDAP